MQYAMYHVAFEIVVIPRIDRRMSPKACFAFLRLSTVLRWRSRPDEVEG